jgi:hypothetical protein
MSNDGPQLPGTAGFILVNGGVLGIGLLIVATAGHTLVGLKIFPAEWYPFIDAIKSGGMTVALVSYFRHYIESEAEKRIANPNLTVGPEPSSVVPAIQKEIEKQVRESNGVKPQTGG